MDTIQQIVANSEDLYAPVLQELDSYWLTSTTLEYSLKQKDYLVIHIRTKIEGEQELLNALYEACEFPDWFGFNWNALNDSISDFHWHPAAGYMIFFSYTPKLDDKEQAIFRDILETAQGRWAEPFGIPFKVFMPKPPIVPYQNGHSLNSE